MATPTKSAKKRSRPNDAPTITDEIDHVLSRKKTLDMELRSLERQIFALESSYLENTAQLGDLIRGWGDFLNPSSPGGPGGSTAVKKRRKVHDNERIFSNSSVTSAKNPEFFGITSASGSSTSGMNGGHFGSHNSTGANSSSIDMFDEESDHTQAYTLDLDVESAPKRKSTQSGQKKLNRPSKRLSSTSTVLGTNSDFEPSSGLGDDLVFN